MDFDVDKNARCLMKCNVKGRLGRRLWNANVLRLL